MTINADGSHAVQPHAANASALIDRFRMRNRTFATMKPMGAPSCGKVP